MKPEIMPATESSILEVKAWLKTEENVFEKAEKAWLEGFIDCKPVRGFHCNWDFIERGWRDGGRLHILFVERQAIGFLSGKDFLEIRPDRRRGRCGKRLAEFMIKAAREDGLSVLEIEIAPSTAEPFWKSMGFTVVDGKKGPGGGIYAYQVLHRDHSSGDGEAVPYVVEYFNEYGFDRPEPRAFARFEGVGERLPDNSIKLYKRAYCFEPLAGDKDCLVRIVIDGETIYFERVKCQSSRAFGIEVDRGDIYYIDRIVLGKKWQ